MTPPRTTSSRAKRPAWSSRPATSSTSSTSRIRTGGRAEWRTALSTSPGWFPLQNSKNGKRLKRILRREGSGPSHSTDGDLMRVCVRFLHRRLASKSKAKQGSQSCSPFGKKKKCKDKYLAKHSSSECSFAHVIAGALLWACLNKLTVLLQFSTSWMWYLMRKLWGSLLLKGKLWCWLVSLIALSAKMSLMPSGLKIYFSLSFQICNLFCTYIY